MEWSNRNLVQDLVRLPLAIALAALVGLAFGFGATVGWYLARVWINQQF